MVAHINIHYAHEISARDGGTTGAPLIISAKPRGSYSGDEITLFTEDFDLTRKLADAINATVEEHRKATEAAKAEAA